MRLTPFLSQNRTLALDGSLTRAGILNVLSASLSAEDPTLEEAVLKAFLEREALGNTYIPEGVAFPHAITPALTNTTLAVAKLTPVPRPPEDPWQNVSLIFAVAGPDEKKWEHLKLFARFYRFCYTPSFLTELRQAGSEEEMYSRLVEEDDRHV